jgi:hypothetical protein
MITAAQAEAIADKISTVHLRLIVFLNEAISLVDNDPSQPPVVN